MTSLAMAGRIAIVAILSLLLGACALADRRAEPTPAPSIPAPPATVAPAAPDEPTPTDGQTAPGGQADDSTVGQAFVGSLTLSVLESFPVQVQAHIRGDLSDGCTSVAGVDVVRDGPTFRIQMITSRDPDAMCTQALVPFERTVDLETRGLAVGTYTVTAGDLSEQFSLPVDKTAAADAPARATPALGGASLVVEATSASPSSTVTLRGAGFPAGATVQIGIGPQGSEYEIIDATQAGADGRFTATIQVPPYAESGESWVFVAQAASGKVVAEPIPIVTAAPTIAAGVNQAEDGLFRRTTIYLIAIGDNGRSGPLIGCQDSAVPVVVEIEPTVAPMTAAIERMLADRRQYYGQSGLYNVFYQSELQLDGINLVDGRAIIALSGALTLGGVCDNPRVVAQLEQTALQYSTVDSVAITLNGQPLEAVLSGRS